MELFTDLIDALGKVAFSLKANVKPLKAESIQCIKRFVSGKLPVK